MNEEDTKTDDGVIKLALERFKRADEASRDNRKVALDDIRFTMGEQWDDAIRTDREADNRPCITINRMQQMVKQVVNDMRQNRAGIRVHAVGGGAREELAELRGGLIRHIEAASNAPDQYAEAANCTVMCGEGYFRILTEYEGDSFDQNIWIKRIRNPLSVYYDPDCREPDGSDAKYAFIIEDIPKTDFTKSYPKADTAPFDADSETTSWIDEETIRVAEYFAIEETEDTIYQLADGSRVRRSELPSEPPSALVLKKRKATKKKCVWRKITGKEVLETTEYPIKLIPVIPVWGEEYDVGGKLYRMGIVRHGKDPQRVYNYSRTAVTEQIALAPKAPYIIAEGQVEGYEDLWGSANVKNHAYLPYKPTSIGGQHVPAPQRQQFTGVPAGSMADLQLASEEIKAVTGIYDAALGARSNETSGKAILARQREADNATYHYVDNLNRAIRFCGRVLNELIPVIYDTQRIVRILGEDGKEEQVELNAPDPVSGEVLNDVTVGEYDVIITTGPSYETKRIEAANSMTQFMQAVPNAAPLVADLIAKNMDWPGADQIAKRLAILLPPQVLAAESGAPQIPPEVQQHMQEMDQQMQEMGQELQQLQTENQQMKVQTLADAKQADVEQYKAVTDRLKVVNDIHSSNTTAQSEDRRIDNEAAATSTAAADAARTQEILSKLDVVVQELVAKMTPMERQHDCSCGS